MNRTEVAIFNVRRRTTWQIGWAHRGPIASDRRESGHAGATASESPRPPCGPRFGRSFAGRCTRRIRHPPGWWAAACCWPRAGFRGRPARSVRCSVPRPARVRDGSGRLDVLRRLASRSESA